MAGPLVARTAVFERGKRQLDGDHLGCDLVDPVTIPHGGSVGRVELGAKVLVLAVQLVQLHGWAPRKTKLCCRTWARRVPPRSRTCHAASSDRQRVKKALGPKVPAATFGLSR